MRELDLWLALGDSDSVADLAIQIDALAHAPLHRRTPFFARLFPLTRHADPRVRQATLKTFAGCDGLRVRRECVAALDDDAPEVVSAALDLIASAPRRSTWAHALFHRRPEVRRDAVVIAMGGGLQGRPQTHDADLSLFLLADADSQGVVVEHLGELQLDRVPFDLLIDLHRSGHLDDGIARRLVLSSSVDDLLVFIREGLSADSSKADVGWLIDLFWDAGDLNDVEYTSSRFPRGVFASLCESIATKRSWWLEKDFVELCRDIAGQRGHWNTEIARICVLGMADEAAWLYEKVLPADVFRTSMEVFYERGLARDEVSGTIVDQLLQLPFCRRPSGQLDLWALGAILHLRRRDGFKRLLGIYKSSQIAAGFDERPEESVRLFSYPGAARERSDLIEAVFARRRKDPFAVAVMMCALPADGLDFAARLTAHETVKALRALSELCVRQGWSVSSNKSAAISHQLSRRFFVGDTLDQDAFAAFLIQWLHGEWSSIADVQDRSLDKIAVDSDHRVVRHCADFSVGVDVMTDVVRRMDTADIAKWIRETLPPATIARFLSLMPCCSGLSYALEIALAQELAGHADPAIARWAGDRVVIADRGTSHQRTLAEIDETSRMTPISDALADEIRTAAPHRLESVVRPLGAGRRRGIAAAFADRADPVNHDERVWACVALLCSGDEIDDVAAGIARYSQDQDGIINAAANELASLGDFCNLGTLGLVVMYRWEAAAFAFAQRCMRNDDECIGWIRLADELVSKTLARDLVQCLARVLALLIARDSPRAAELLTESHLAAWLERLPTSGGKQAAGVMMRTFKAGLNPSAMAALRDRAAEILPNVPDELQFALRPWVDAADLGSMAITARVRKEPSSPDLASEIAVCTDLHRLSDWLEDRNSGVVSDAAVRLVELGQAGIRNLVATLTKPSPVRCVSMVAESIALWPAESIEILRELIDGDQLMPDSVRFLVALEALDAFGAETADDSGIPISATLDDIAQWLLRPCDVSWVHVLEMQRLIQWFSPHAKDTYAAMWVDSPHPNVYRFAVAHNIARLNMIGDEVTSEVCSVEAALVRFLRHGTDRDSTSRLSASVALARRGNWIGFPILLSHRLSKEFGKPHDPLESMPEKFCPDELVVEMTQSLLMAGPKAVAETTIASLVDFYRSSENVVAAGRLVMREAVNENVRQSAAQLMRSDVHRQAKLRRIATVFQRGVRLGRELTGRLFTIEMIGGSDFGYTRLNADRVFINPMPLLNGTANAEDVVEGLILHELGHHLYHRGEQQQAVWERADSMGMGKLLNLVADEHLERNLRALDRSYGDQLKRLGAYAFNRSAKEFDVDYVLNLLGRHTAAVLQTHPPGVARNPACLRVRGGALLQELERSGSSFSRFFRALRLGLGNRHDDPKVAEGLALFDKGFRKLQMPQLFEICKRLREIFGDEACMQRCLSVDDLISDPDGDVVVKADGLSNDELQSEIQRIHRKPSESSESGGSGGVRAINVGEDMQFDLITQIRRLPFHPATYQPYARQVAATSRRFRGFLRDLGLSNVRCPRRIRGRQVDGASLKQLVLKGDPRVLVAREVRYHNDLFLSVVVDCSGSMEFGDNMSKAKLFAAMMAEACRELEGVDLRLFGFTDSEIYDAGDARRPAVAELRSGGGNNDAAALWHAAEVASQSNRSAKVVVMISDGLPTECSTEALKALVARLSRRRDLVCAQVAVQSLEEVCFSHYIELTDADTMVSVQRFGAIVARLVKGIL